MEITEYYVRVKSWENIEVTVNKKEVLADNDDYIVFKDNSFSKIQKNPKGRGRYDSNIILDKVTCSDWTKGFCSGLGVMFTIHYYTTQPSKKICENKINREFNKWLEKEANVYVPSGNFKIDFKSLLGGDV